jgi:hypothetical protein
MGKIGKYLVTLFLIFLNGLLFAQKPEIQLSINKKPVEVGQNVVFTIKTNIDGAVEFDFPSTFMQGGNSKSVQQSFINNAWTFSIEIAQGGVFKKEGKYSISAQIKDKGKVYKSNVLAISVRPKSDPSKARKYENNEGDITKHNMKEPVFGIIQKSSAKVYEGEPLILAAKVYSRVNLNMMQDYKPFSLKGAAETFELEKSDNFSLTRENYQGNNFLTFSCGKQLVFPATPGKFIVKPFEMVLQYNTGGFFDSQLRLESNATFIDVLPLPKGAPKSFIGAVGKFSLESSVSKSKLKAGDLFTIVMKVSGSGNLHAISKPKIELPEGLIFYGDPEIKEDIDYTDDGVSGFKTFLFHVKANQGGKITLPNLAICYFDPGLKKYVTIKGESTTLDIEGDGSEVGKVQIADSTSNMLEKEVIVNNPNTQTVDNQESIPHANKWIVFLLLIIILLGSLLFFSWRKKAKKNSIKHAETFVQQPFVSSSVEIQKPSVSFLEDAQTYAERMDYNASFGLIHKHLSKYILNSLTIKNQDAVLDSIEESMKNHQFPDTIIDDYQWIIKTCEEVIYGYLDKSSDWDLVYQKSKGIISYINNR